MGDIRYERALERVESARTEGQFDSVSGRTAIAALGALAARGDAVLANVLTTRALNESERSERILRFLAEGVVAIDADGLVAYANPAAHRLLGFAEGTLVGRDFHDTVHHGKAGEGEVARENCTLLRTMDDATDDRLHRNDHDVFERADGSTFLVGFTAGAIPAEPGYRGVAVVFRDITEIKERERHLALFQAALDVVPEPVFWVDREGRFLYANAAAGRHTGIEPAALREATVFDIDADFEPGEVWDTAWRKIQREGSGEVRTRHRIHDGSIVPVVVSVAYVEHEGREFHVALVRPDVSASA